MRLQGAPGATNQRRLDSQSAVSNRSCQADLLEMLDDAGLLVPIEGGVGPGLDCAVVPTKHEGLVLVSTIDFFYPLVLDPYMQARAPTL